MTSQDSKADECSPVSSTNKEKQQNLNAATTHDMHPLLDRPHPDCGNEITSLKACHADTWKKFTGQCDDIKVALDVCFRAEKKRKVDELAKTALIYRKLEEDMLKETFGHSMTFTEYLQKDRDDRKSKSEAGPR